MAEWLVEHKIDVVLTREDMRHKGPPYVFADAGVKIENISSDQLDEALDEILSRM